MKSIIITILIVSFAMISQNTYGQTKEQILQTETKDSTNTNILTYTVYGMDCPGCQGALEKQLKKIPWITKAEANWIKQEVKVQITADSLLVEEEIYKKIRKANFTPADKKKDE